MPEGLKEEAECIADYSIWNMAKKILERENLSNSVRSYYTENLPFVYIKTDMVHCRYFSPSRIEYSGKIPDLNYRFQSIKPPKNKYTI